MNEPARAATARALAAWDVQLRECVEPYIALAVRSAQPLQVVLQMDKDGRVGPAKVTVYTGEGLTR